jgi:WD40 repeat protein
MMESVTWNPDGTKIAAGVVVRHDVDKPHDNFIKIFDAQTGEEKLSLYVDVDLWPDGDGRGRILCVSYAPTGDMVAAGCSDGKIYLVDAFVDDPKGQFSRFDLLSVDGKCHSVPFSPDGSKIAAAYGTGIQLFDAQKPEKLGSPWRGHTRFRDARNPECICCFSEDDEEEALEAIDSDEERPLTPFPRPDCPVRGHSESVASVAWSPDGTTIVSTDGETIKLWNTSTGECESTLRGHAADNTTCICQHLEDEIVPDTQDPACPVNGHWGLVSGVCFSPDGSYLVSCGRDKTVRLWNTQTAESIGSRSQIA